MNQWSTNVLFCFIFKSSQAQETSSKKAYEEKLKQLNENTATWLGYRAKMNPDAVLIPVIREYKKLKDALDGKK